MHHRNKNIRRKRTAKRMRGFVMRRPYVSGVLTSAGSVLVKSAADYWLPGLWEWLAQFAQALSP